MQRLLVFISQNAIRLLLVVKLVVVVAVLLHTKGGFYFGDRTATAADEEKETSEEAPKIAHIESEDVPIVSDEDQDKGRRSFLQDLLNLPKAQPESLKKEEIGRYLNLIEKKRSQVEDRLSLLEKRETQLKGIEKTIETKIRKLEDEMRFFDESLQKEKKVNDERLEQLVEFYKKMPPKKAAPVFEKLNKDLIVALFNRIPKKQTTEILGLMNPEKSVEISEYYGRIRSGNEYEMLKEMNAELRQQFNECKGMPREK